MRRVSAFPVPVLALLVAGLVAGFGKAARSQDGSRPPTNPASTARQLAIGEPGPADALTAPPARIPYFALSSRLRPGRPDATRGAAFVLGAGVAARERAFGFGGAVVDGATVGDYELSLALPPDPKARRPKPGDLPLAASGSQDPVGRHTFLEEMWGTMAVPDDAVKRWSPGHAPDPVASRFLKGRPVTTRSPDVEFDVNARTSLGLYGEVVKPEKGDPLNGTALPRTKDHGAGVTLQYRFDSH